VRALPAYARSYRLIQAWTDEGAARCSLAQQVFWVICVVASGSAATKPCFIDYPSYRSYHTDRRLTITTYTGDDDGCRPFYVEGPFGPKSSTEKLGDAKAHEPFQNSRQAPQDPPR
jgi:hypothetical protein